VFGFATDGEDEAKIEMVLAKSRNLSQLIGDCGDDIADSGRRIYRAAHFTRTERNERPSFVWVQ
jgi:hypothetical protein